MALPSFERIQEAICAWILAVRGVPLEKLPCPFCGQPFLHMIDASLVLVDHAVKPKGPSYDVRVTCSCCAHVLCFDALTVGLLSFEV